MAVGIYSISGFENAENGYVEDLSVGAKDSNHDQWNRIQFIKIGRAHV